MKLMSVDLVVVDEVPPEVVLDVVDEVNPVVPDVVVESVVLVVDVKLPDSLLLLNNAVNDIPDDAGLNAMTDTHRTEATMKRRPRTYPYFLFLGVSSGCSLLAVLGMEPYEMLKAGLLIVRPPILSQKLVFVFFFFPQIFGVRADGT